MVKLATEITERKKQSAGHNWQIDPINRSRVVIEFNLDDTIVSANQNFLDDLGSSLTEIQDLQQPSETAPPTGRLI